MRRDSHSAEHQTGCSYRTDDPNRRPSCEIFYEEFVGHADFFSYDPGVNERSSRLDHVRWDSRERCVADVMTRAVIWVRDTAPARQVADVLSRSGVGALPVVDNEQRLRGIVSASDLNSRLGATDPSLLTRRGRRARRLANSATAATVMTRTVTTAGSLITVRQAARTMQDARIRYLPIVDGQQRLLGIVSYSDLLRIFLRDDAQVRHHIIEDLLAGRADGTADVDVQVKDGRVTLTGRLPGRALRADLLAAIRDIAGVTDVVDQLVPRIDLGRRPLPYARVATGAAAESAALGARITAVQSGEHIAFRTA